MWSTDYKIILLRAVFQYDQISQKKRGVGEGYIWKQLKGSRIKADKARVKN